MLTAGLAWLMLRMGTLGSGSRATDLYNHQVLLVISSLLLFVVPFVIIMMMRKIPGRYLHGYEAVYQIEKEKSKKGEAETGVLTGLKMLVQYPYVMGIFGMAFFYEVIATILSYLCIDQAEKNAAGSMSGTLEYLLVIAFWAHFVGIFISFFGTSALFNKLGTRRCLMLIPISSGLALIYFLTSPCLSATLQFVFVLFRSINYAFSWPLRESLYIPTVKEIKFKSKSWVDAFGSKIAKSSGSACNAFIEWMGPAMILFSHTLLFSVLVGFWIVTAWLLGKRFERAVAKNEVIGVEG
jgi:ATP:ADP antiporter, AAA family